MLLKVFIENEKLKATYQKHIDCYHKQQLKNAPFYDAGFDILCPDDKYCDVQYNVQINFGIKCAAYLQEDGVPIGFSLCARSSIAKTNLRLANNIGIIDSGYRGNIIGAFDCFKPYQVQANDRLLQIVAPAFLPIQVELVEKESDLGLQTNRQEKGHGSSGR